MTVLAAPPTPFSPAAIYDAAGEHLARVMLSGSTEELALAREEYQQAMRDYVRALARI